MTEQIKKEMLNNLHTHKGESLLQTLVISILHNWQEAFVGLVIVKVVMEQLVDYRHLQV